ncbi:MAG: aspartate kinase [Kiritimatiellia bacterium]
MKVAKFGGTSLADAKQILKVISIVKADPARRIVVVSAPGKRTAKDTKVTDLLIALAEARLAGKTGEAELAAVVVRFAEIGKDLDLPEAVVKAVERDLRGRMDADRSSRGLFLDLLKAAGEDNSARITAAAFTKQGVPARYLNPKEAGLILTDDPGNATVLPESYPLLARTLADTREVIVFPGFFGCTKTGGVVTFPRGGSDITGAILAAAVKASEYENFTDVDSVFAVDPRIVAGAKAISLLTYREMRELAYAGFGVFHDEAIVPAVQAHIPICIKNTNRPEAPGTRIVPARSYAAGGVVGIASADGFCTLSLDKYLMNREIGFGRRLLQIIEDEELPYEHVPSGIDNISVVLREASLNAAKKEKILARCLGELKADDAEFEMGLALIMVVGEGMRYTVGLARRATAALSNAGVNIEMMNQGASEISMMFGVKAVDRKKAVKALYEAFFEVEPS